MKNMFRFSIILLSSVFISGCYVSKQPIFARGDYIMEEGMYQCKDSDGKTEMRGLTIESKGWRFKDYTYVFNSNFIKFRDTSITFPDQRKFAIMQRFNRETNYYDLLALRYSNKTFEISSFLPPATITQDETQAFYRQLAKEKSINFELRYDNLTGVSGYIISGDEQNIINFFAAHDPRNFSFPYSCQRVPNQ
jgi:hypothetical protein